MQAAQLLTLLLLGTMTKIQVIVRCYLHYIWCYLLATSKCQDASYHLIAAGS